MQRTLTGARDTLHLTIALLAILSSTRPLINSTFFDGGYLGAYSYESFQSTDLVAPQLNHLRRDPSCDDGLILFSPRSHSVPYDGPAILNGAGELIWSEKKYGTVDNLQIQTYKGQKYLTFWAGVHTPNNWPGKNYLLDSSYKVKYIISPVGFEYGDLHEFKILEGGTALLTFYYDIRGDLSALGGPRDGWLRDSGFQEVDIETGELVFEWRASKHYTPSKTLRPLRAYGNSEVNPFEYFHINSIEKDEGGNYLISSRFFWEVALISGRDGTVTWRLGGRNSSFEDLSDGAASNFSWQHDARLHGLDPDEPSGQSIIISLFDNAIFEHDKPTGDEARGMLISLDLQAMTVELIQEFKNPLGTLANAMGSMQVLRSGNQTARDSNVLVGWGYGGGWTEYKPGGEVLCDTHFAAYSFWNFGWASTYRVFKYDTDTWVGKPKQRPAIAVGINPDDLDVVYASWNGATEVRQWKLQGAEGYSSHLDSDDSLWIGVDVRPKMDFEVAFHLGGEDEDMHGHRDSNPMRKRHQHGDKGRHANVRYVRVLALGDDDEVLDASLPLDRHTRMLVGLPILYACF